LSCFEVGLSLHLFTRGLCLCLAPFPWEKGKGKVSDLSAGCQHVVVVCCLFLNAAEPSDCGCPGTEPCSLPPLLLLYFRQGLSPTHCRPSCHLFTDGSREFSSLPLPLLWCAFSNPCPLCCVLVFSSVVHCSDLFLVFFFCRGAEISLSRGVVLVYPRGGGGILCEAWHSPVWSAEGL
jgi:hypothetical protein